jgi:hypothetical protein
VHSAPRTAIAVLPRFNTLVRSAELQLDDRLPDPFPECLAVEIAPTVVVTPTASNSRLRRYQLPAAANLPPPRVIEDAWAGELIARSYC